MAKKIAADVAAAIAAEPVKEASPDKLDLVRDGVKRQAETAAKIKASEAELKRLNKQLNDIRFKELPELFEAAGVSSLGLEDVDAYLEPFYRANIGADWPEDKKQKAFDKLVELGGQALIKVVVTAEFDRGATEQVELLAKFLEDNGIEYSSRLGVPWQSLTAFVKEQVEAGNADVLSAIEIIGATVGKIVRVKEKKA